MTDYLSDNEIYPPDWAMPEDGFPAAEVREAALSLMVNPNNRYARLVLLHYANFKPWFSRNERYKNDEIYFCALLAITAGRISRDIYRYDRYGGSLRGFLFSRFRWAERQLIKELAGPNALQNSAHLTKYSVQPPGAPARFPLHREYGDGDGNKARAAIGYTVLMISEEELVQALEACERNNTPVSAHMTGYGREYSLPEREQIFLRFSSWWRQNEPKKATDFALQVFEQYFVHAKNAPDSYGAVAGLWPGRTAHQAKDAIYDHARPAFKRFSKADAELSRDLALEKLYGFLKEK